MTQMALSLHTSITKLAGSPRKGQRNTQLHQSVMKPTFSSTHPPPFYFMALMRDNRFNKHVFFFIRKVKNIA